MITFKELQTLADIFSKPVPDNPILSDIEDTLECAVIEGRTRFSYVSLKYDKEVADEAIWEDDWPYHHIVEPFDKFVKNLKESIEENRKTLKQQEEALVILEKYKNETTE